MKEQNRHFLKGLLVQEIFYNEENGYGVYLMKVEEASEPIEEREVTIVGHFLRPNPEEVYTCYGEWQRHPRYGKQYHVTQIKKEYPKTKEAIIKYLSSDFFPGVGKKSAEKIVDQLGEDALAKMVANPDLLMEIEGLTKKQIATIRQGLEQHHAIEQAMLFLYELGFGPALALKIVQQYKEDTISLIKENPYRLIDEIEGIGFKRADELARQFGIAETSPERFKAAVMYVLKEASYTYGHVFLTYDELTDQVYELLEVDELFDEEQIREYLADLLEEKKIFLEEGRLYLRSLYFAEDRLALKIRSLLHQPVEHGFAIADLYRVIGELEEEFQVTYAEQQREAMIRAISSPLMILTGGPGTGKTTVIRGICHLFARLYEFSLDPDVYEANDKPFPIRLVAPTGRAAKRMSETTGLPAMTIHRLLGWKGTYFEHNEENPVEGMLLIVDETSMLDILLANKLFQAIPPGMQVILVGDPDQLPSVGPGQVLHHLLQVKEIPRVELTEVFRQAESSSIIRLAHHIKHGELPEDLLKPLPDRRFFPCRREQVLSVVLKTYENALKRGYTPFDVQVLAPIYKGPAGVDRLNQEIQQLVNPRKEGRKELVWGEQIFRQGDKVLQLVNHPEYPIYNGDMGVIIAIDETAAHDQPVLWVQFDRLEVPYKRSQLGQISLAYACSVHKSQGSEFPIVIFPVLHAYRRMLERNLIYTAITRSKSYLILCGEADALRYGISQVRGEMRNSRLKDLIVPAE